MFKFNLTDMTEDDLRTTLDKLLDMSASLPKEDFQAEISSYGRRIVLNTHDDVVAFREGFIMSRVSGFERAAQEPWKYTNTLLH